MCPGPNVSRSDVPVFRFLENKVFQSKGFQSFLYDWVQVNSSVCGQKLVNLKVKFLNKQLIISDVKCIEFLLTKFCEGANFEKYLSEKILL